MNQFFVFECVYCLYTVCHETALPSSYKMFFSFFLSFFSANKYDIKPEHILLVHDELDKPLGKVAVKHGGSARCVTLNPVSFKMFCF